MFRNLSRGYEIFFAGFVESDYPSTNHMYVIKNYDVVSLLKRKLPMPHQHLESIILFQRDIEKTTKKKTTLPRTGALTLQETTTTT